MCGPQLAVKCTGMRIMKVKNTYVVEIDIEISTCMCHPFQDFRGPYYLFIFRGWTCVASLNQQKYTISARIDCDNVYLLILARVFEVVVTIIRDSRKHRHATLVGPLIEDASALALACVSFDRQVHSSSRTSP